MHPGNLTRTEWKEAIAKTMAANNVFYTTATRLMMETGKPLKKVRYELNKMIKADILYKVPSYKGVWYFFKIK